jgi:UDP-glucuronate decarboxylase
VDGLVRLMATEDAVTGPINLGNPHEVTVRELAERVVRLTGSGSALVRRELPADDPVQRCPDIGMARRVLGWEPTVALENGLVRTVEYFRRMMAESAARGRATELARDEGYDPIRSRT